jgi:amino acid adenylation domain-containing protein
VGELYIAGDALARGYLNDPEKTGGSFVPNVFPGIRGDRLYKTGDRARWLPNGTVEFLGRLDYQVKVRGYRIEPGEIEKQILGYEGVNEALVMVREHENGEKYLCAYIVPSAPDSAGAVSIPALKEYLSGHLPDYMIPPYILTLDRMPLNPNGKVDRKALPEPERTAAGGYVPPRNEREKILVDIWSGVLGEESSRIGIDDNFFHLGGHSLKAVALAGRIHKAFSVEIPITELFKSPTVKSISAYIEKNDAGIYSSLIPVEKKEYYPLSSAQKRIFFIHRLAPDAVTYNLPAIMKMQGNLDRERFERAFKQLIQRHESLRTSFEMHGDTPVQKIHETVEFEVEYDGTEETFSRPFDLSRAPLLRVRLLKTGENVYSLMFDMHHIAADGVSMGALVKEFTAFYSGASLPGIQFQYKDFAHWQNSLLLSGKMSEQAAYWQSQFEGEIPVLTLPADYPRPSVKQFAGNSINFELGAAAAEDLRKLALETGSTLYMVLFALYTLFLSKLSGSEDIVTGTVVAGRNRYESEDIIGMFVNTMAIRTNVPGMKPFPDFLTEVGENLLAAFENQDYQYEELVETLEIERDLSRNPLFDTLFVLQNMTVSRVELPGLKLEPRAYHTGTSKFDLTFTCEESEENLIFVVQYSTKLFKEQTVEKFIRYFKKLAAFVTRENNRDIKIGEIEIISEAERNRLIYDYNDTVTEYPSRKMLHELFEEQVEKTPDNIALVFKDEALTYRALDKRAGSLSSALMEKGVKSGIIVVLMVERSIEMIVGLLAIFKAGGTYLPVDTEYPIQRIQYMVDDSFSRSLVTRRHLLNMNRLEFEGTVIDIDEKNIYRGVGDARCPGVTRSPGNPAYVIYTSGSTGKPRGVLVEHFSVVNLVFCQMERFRITIHDRVLQFSSTCFDASVEQIFITLFSGAALVLTDTDTLLDNGKFEALVSSRSITHIHAVPAFLSNIRLKDTSPLKRVVSGGDVCPVSLAKKWSKNVDFYNKYGPTETTVTSIEKKIEDVDDDLPRLSIGRPINNTTVYLFDKWMRMVPPGAVGELYIGGEGVARGYLNRPALTLERFIPNPLAAGEVLYRTGDLARWKPDGDIEFLGRTDFQVKIRGHRIELGEIENRLLKHEEIQEAVVAARQEGENSYLCAYIVPISPRPPGIAGFSHWREYLLRFLPGYMVPAHFVLIEKVPLTPSGKVDRKALPAPDRAAAGVYVPPRNEREKVLVDIWSGILGVESSRIGIDDNFFHLGGHSLNAIGLAARIHKRPATRSLQPKNACTFSPGWTPKAPFTTCLSPWCWRGCRIGKNWNRGFDT